VILLHEGQLRRAFLGNRLLLMARVLVIDTSILCVWLEVPGKETCGSENDQWNKQRVEDKIQQEIQAGATLVLPLATIIETGNHIAQVSQNYGKAKALAKIMADAADENTPWAAFIEQSTLWDAEGLKQLSTQWLARVAKGDSIGDVTITTVANYYAEKGFSVEILTGDSGLKAYEPTPPPEIPKRRRRSG
jgi:hypothetical protein